MDVTLPGFDAAIDASNEPTIEYLELASKLSQQAGYKLTIDKLTEFASKLLNMVEYFRRNSVRWAIMRADKRNGGIVAYIVRRKIKSKLPEPLNTDDVAKLVISLIATLLVK